MQLTNRAKILIDDLNILVDVNSSQPQNEGDSIGSIIFKGIMSPSGTQNGTYYQYLVNQSQVEMGVPVNSGQSKG